MNSTKMFDAMSKIDDNLVERCINDNNETTDQQVTSQNPLSKKTRFFKLGVVIASFVLILESLLKTNTQKPEGEEEKIIAANNSGKTKYIRRLTGFTCALLSFVVISIIAVLIIVPLNNRTPTDVAKINTSIANLANMDSDEERILEIMKIEKDIQSISSDKQSKINTSKLSHESSSTINKLKASVEWKDHINNDDKYYPLWSIINCDLINRIEFRKERFGSETWICNNEDFYNDLLTILDLPYANLLDNLSDELTHTFSDYSNFYSFTLHLKNNELVDLGVYNGGYVTICIKGTDDEEQIYRIKNCYVSLIKLDTSKFYSFMDDNNLSKYDIESSVISIKTLSLIQTEKAFSGT